MNFPITLQTQKEFELFLKEHKSIILNFYNIDKKITKLKNKLKLKKDKYSEKLEKLETQNRKLQELVELKEKQFGEHSMYKGEFDEKHKELILNKYFDSNFTIDGKKKMHCMDIRMIHKQKNYTVGIECKNKKNITQKDIDKFKNDKLNNPNFKLSIFLSTDSPIKNKVCKLDNYNFINDELYIYSKDIHYIIIIIQLFIKLYETKETDENEIGTELYIDIITNLYKNWCCLKKNCLKMDYDLVKSLKRIDINLEKGHLFIISKTKCKNNCDPY